MKRAYPYYLVGRNQISRVIMMKKVCKLCIQHFPGVSLVCQCLKTCIHGLARQTESTAQDWLADETDQIYGYHVYLRMFQCCRVALVLGCILLHAAWPRASRQCQKQRTPKFSCRCASYFKGNTTSVAAHSASSWPRHNAHCSTPGDAANRNPPNVELISYASKNTTFDHGFLESSVRVDDCQEDPEKQTVRDRDCC